MYDQTLRRLQQRVDELCERVLHSEMASHRDALDVLFSDEAKPREVREPLPASSPVTSEPECDLLGGCGDVGKHVGAFGNDGFEHPDVDFGAAVPVVFVRTLP